MLNRNILTTRFPVLKKGLHVKTKDGENLGKIISMDDLYFTVEKGFFFPKDFTVRYDDIEDVLSNVAYLTHTKGELSDWQNEYFEGWRHVEEANQEERVTKEEIKAREGKQPEMMHREELKVPVMEEELDATKVAHQRGEVKLRKIVHTEFKHFTVPVMSEEVTVERTPAAPEASSAVQGEGSFEDKTISVPVFEEKVEIHKHPVVKEEVRVIKEQFQEAQEVSGEIRKEEVQVEGGEEYRHKRPRKTA